MKAEQLMRQALPKLQAHSPRASCEVREILAFVLGMSPAEVVLHDELLPADACGQFRQLINRRCQQVPLDYILKYAHFWKHRFVVEDHALAPREETQLMIEAMLDLYPTTSKLRCADVGCGTGVIAISLALEFTNSTFWAIDIDERNTGLSRKNAELLGASNLQYQVSDLLEGSASTFDVILSNPPYVESHLLPGLHDPRLALDGGADGLNLITRLIQESPSHLAPLGRIFIEHGNQQAPRVRSLLEKNGFDSITSLKDLYAQPRITYGRLSSR